MKISNRIYINFGKAGKFDGDIMLDNPRHGYNWFYYLPHFHSNKGNPFKSHVLGMGLFWLCFWFGFTLYPSWVNKKENQASQLKSNK